MPGRLGRAYGVVAWVGKDMWGMQVGWSRETLGRLHRWEKLN